MIEIIIDGIKISARRETTILEAALANGFDIPALCRHPGLPLDGNCRLCSVEIIEDVRERIVASCMFPIRRSIEVRTNTPKLAGVRKTILQLLINRNPEASELRELCAKYGVTPEERFSHEPDLCIRCGRCVRACEINGGSAIGFAGRGFGRHVAPPYGRGPEACIGCLACQAVCPTGKITFEETPGRRVIWRREFETVRCKRCGAYFATNEMLDWANVLEGERDYCERCRKALTGASFKGLI